MPNSWKPEVYVQRAWTGNQLRFATEAEAKAQVLDLYRRWTLVDDTRVTETSDPVNAKWIEGKGLIQQGSPEWEAVTATAAAETIQAA